MGSVLCKGTGQSAVDKKIQATIKNDYEEQRTIPKLLLLGTGGCGKSTILKQIQILHANGFTAEEYKGRRPIIYSNTVIGMWTMLQALNALQLHLRDERMADVKLVKRTVADRQDGEPFSAAMSLALKNLWKEQVVKLAFQQRNQFQLEDCVEYFLDEIDRISANDYEPTEQDYLRSRFATTGAVHIEVNIKDTRFRFVDVGGERSERRKWIHLFDDVTAVIFITAINEFDQTLREDKEKPDPSTGTYPTEIHHYHPPRIARTPRLLLLRARSKNRTIAAKKIQNRMQESMELFKQTTNCPWFTKAVFVLFLNKTDLFRQKLQKNSSIRSLFKNYTGTPYYTR